MHYTQGVTDCTPEEVGFDSSRIQTLLNHFERMIDKKEILCAAYCVSRKGKVFMHGAVGPISYNDADKPLQPTTVQYIASITKVFTAIAIMKLVEDGYARLDTPVGEILPQFNTPPFNNINLFHLLTHTSGLHPDGGCFENKYHRSQWEYIEKYIKSYKPEDGEFDWLTPSMSCNPRKEIGEQWQYCSFGFVVLGAVIEKLSGKFANDYIVDEIAKPLGMTSTCFELTPEMAQNHIVQNKNHEKELAAIIKRKAPTKEEKLWSKIPRTGGGLESTVSDLIRFGNMLLGNGTLDDVRIIGRKALEKLTTRAIFNTPDFCWNAKQPDRSYGIGFDMREGPAFTYSKGTFHHEGAGAASLIMDPSEELTAAWFVPFADDKWYASALYNVQNIIWSGLK